MFLLLKQKIFCFWRPFPFPPLFRGKIQNKNAVIMYIYISIYSVLKLENFISLHLDQTKLKPRVIK